MLQFLFIDEIWLAVIIGQIFQISEYYLSLFVDKKYKESRATLIQYEDDFQHTPYFHIEANPFTKHRNKFWVTTILQTLSTFAIWRITIELSNLPDYFYFFYGLLYFKYLPIIILQFQTIFKYHKIELEVGVSDSTKYTSWVLQLDTSTDLFLYTILYFVLYLFIGGWILIGAGTGTLLLALNHRLEYINQFSPENLYAK